MSTVPRSFVNAVACQFLDYALERDIEIILPSFLARAHITIQSLPQALSAESDNAEVSHCL